MFFRWLKRYVPGSLYGRAGLILILPVVVLQLVVSIAFIQRHFEEVTEQMTQTVILQLRYIEEEIRDAPFPQAALEQLAPLLTQLNMTIEFPQPGNVPAQDSIRWYDFSGRVVIQTLREFIPETKAVLLPNDRSVITYLSTRFGPAEITFGRRRVSAAAPHQLLVTMLFFGVLMTAVAYIYLRNQLRPITRLASAAEAFGRGRTEAYSPSGAIEVRVAGNAFLDMRARIERQIEQRTLMLSGVSHDLRTPLTRLKLGVSMLDQAEAAPLLRDVDEMQRLLDSFLSFAKGAFEGEPESVDPHALVTAVVEDARRSGTDVLLVDLSGQGLMKLRPMAIRRALENLIGNAVRYGTRAEVSVTLTDRSLRISVEDDGPGIPADQRAEAVKPFSRLDPARNQNKGTGVGLGLAIAADVARAHGGVLRLGGSDRLGGLRADIVIAR